MKYIYTLLLFFPLSLQAQFVEGGLMAGASTYLGDLVVGSIDSKEIHPAYGGFVRYTPFALLSFKASLMFATVSGDDGNATRELWRKERNLSFRSNIYEFSVGAELNLTGFNPDVLKKTFSPYLLGGVSIFRFNPKALYNGDWVELQPLGTEGQGIPDRPKPYQLTQISFPVGFGLKYAINDLWNIGMEFGYRFAMTDYLDDVSSTYVTRNELIEANGELAANLANRTGEYLNTPPVIVATGTGRGRENIDVYMIFGITISYNFIDNGLVGGRRRN